MSFIENVKRFTKKMFGSFHEMAEVVKGGLQSLQAVARRLVHTSGPHTRLEGASLSIRRARRCEYRHLAC